MKRTKNGSGTRFRQIGTGLAGVVLFMISLLINFLAQKIVRRYRISIG